MEGSAIRVFLVDDYEPWRQYLVRQLRVDSDSVQLHNAAAYVAGVCGHHVHRKLLPGATESDYFCFTLARSPRRGISRIETGKNT